MKAKIDRYANLDLTCDNCGYEFKKTVGWLENEGDFSCPNGCGETDNLTEFIRDLDKSFNAGANAVRKSFDDLNK